MAFVYFTKEFLPLRVLPGFSGTNRRNTVHCFLSGWFLPRLFPPVTRTSMFLNLLMFAYALAVALILCGNSAQRFGCLYSSSMNCAHGSLSWRRPRLVSSSTMLSSTNLSCMLLFAP